MMLIALGEFQDAPGGHCSDWEVLNYDQGFLTWLQGRDSELDPPNSRGPKNWKPVLGASMRSLRPVLPGLQEDPGYTPPGVSAPGGPKKEDIVQPTPSAAARMLRFWCSKYG